VFKGVLARKNRGGGVNLPKKNDRTRKRPARGQSLSGTQEEGRGLSVKRPRGFPPPVQWGRKRSQDLKYIPSGYIKPTLRAQSEEKEVQPRGTIVRWALTKMFSPAGKQT